MPNEVLRNWSGRIAAPVGRGLAAMGVSANALTLAGLPLVAAGAWLVAGGSQRAGALLFLAGSVTDLFDGAVARASGRHSAFGGFLDSVTDRLADAMMLGSVALWLGRPGVMGRAGLALGVASLVAAFMVSYVRARAEAAGFTADVGLGERGVRVFLVVAGLAFDVLYPAIVVLLVLTSVTVLQRIASVRRQARAAAGPLGDGKARPGAGP